MRIETVWIGGAWRDAAAPAGAFRATNPADGAEIGPLFPISSAADVEACVAAAAGCAANLRDAEPARIAAFLEAYAARIEAAAGALAARAQAETGLAAEGRFLKNELPRTTRQLRLAAEAARTQNWTQPIIDTQAGLRSCFAPLARPVLILGPNNFPFAFNSISGGDFAAAIAARNPVIAKGHPGHPATTAALAHHAADALAEAGLPAASVQLVFDIPREQGLKLCGDRRLGAIAFTGSRGAGLALKSAADTAGVPIYAEMSSLNPVFLLPGAVAARGEAIAEELLTSATAGAGQFCTNPGLIVLIDGPAAQRFVQAAVQRYSAAPPGLLLGRSVLASLEESLRELKSDGARVLAGEGRVRGPGFRHAATLLAVTGRELLASPAELQREAFGPATLLVLAADAAELTAIAASLEGNLTGSIYATADDEPLHAALAPVLRDRVGRLLEDRMPTGVAGSPAMNHGGPYPATSHPGFTAVGIPSSIRRFAALHSYDHVRDAHLPAVLRDGNPDRVWRCIDGRYTQESIQ